MKSAIRLGALWALLWCWAASERALAAEAGSAPAPGWARPIELDYGVVRAGEMPVDGVHAASRSDKATNGFAVIAEK